VSRAPGGSALRQSGRRRGLSSRSGILPYPTEIRYVVPQFNPGVTGNGINAPYTGEANGGF